jgi:hypothetical protein
VRSTPAEYTVHLGRALRAITICLLALCAAAVPSRERALAATVTPSLMLVSQPGHSLAAVGRHWGRHVVVTARIGASIGGVALASQSGGRFTVALDFTVACGGVTVEARDYRGDDVTARRPGPECPNRIGDLPPLLSVLAGTAAVPRLHVLRHAVSPRTLTLHLGDELRITERGLPIPSFMPSADAQHFLLLGQGVQKSPNCSMGTCDAPRDQYWTWIAVKTGRAIVSLAPACRQSRPPCELAEAVIDITIVG